MPDEADIKKEYIDYLQGNAAHNLDETFRHLLIAYRYLHTIAGFYHLDLKLEWFFN